MLEQLDSRQATDSALGPGSRWILAFALVLGLSILYQVYIYDFDQGVLTGGEGPRLYLKILSSLLFVIALRHYLSLQAFTLNLALKLPILFVAATILFLSPFLSTEYKQGLNLLFFLPVLLIDWNRHGGAHLFRTIWTLIAVVVLIQLVLDPLCKVYFQAGWSNAAVIGGMGNPNVFGIFLIASGLACMLLPHSRLRNFAPLLLLATVATGSLAASLVGVLSLMVQLLLGLKRAPLRSAIILGVLVVVVSASTIAIELVTDSPSITHAFEKFLGLQQLLRGAGTPDSDSFTIRIQYLRNGLEMLADSPLGIIVGHPGAVPMYNGDGLWTSFLVTYGLPVTLYFLAVNLIVIRRALRVRSPESLLAGGAVLAMLAFFVTNRILDYWPAGLLYLLAFSYLTNKGVRRPPTTAAALAPDTQAVVHPGIEGAARP